MQVKCRTTIQSIWTLLPPNLEISSKTLTWGQLIISALMYNVYDSNSISPPVDLCSLTCVLPKTLPKRKKLHIFNGFFGGKCLGMFISIHKTKNVKKKKLKVAYVCIRNRNMWPIFHCLCLQEWLWWFFFFLLFLVFSFCLALIFKAFLNTVFFLIVWR